MKKYEVLKEHYPEYISLDQMRVICKIAKRSASYLLIHGIIPAEDTGRKTWRYRIRLDDVITYLRRREQAGSMIPYGLLSSRKTGKKRGVKIKRTFSNFVEPGREWEVAEYFSYILADCDDVVTTADIVEMTGLTQSTVVKLLKSGHIKSIMDRPTYFVPKQYLLDFVVTRKFLECRTNS